MLVENREPSIVGIVAILLFATVLIIAAFLFVMRASPFGAVGTESDEDINFETQDENVPGIEVPDVSAPAY